MVPVYTSKHLQVVAWLVAITFCKTKNMKQVKENMNANSKQTIQTSFYYTTVLPIEVYSREVHAVFSYFF